MAKKLWDNIQKNQIARFVLSAGVGFLVDISVFYILYHNLLTEKHYIIFGFKLKNSTVSLMISYLLGVVVNFLMSKYLVFQQSRTSSYKQFFRFTSVAIIGFFANLGIIDVFIHYLNMYPPLARPLAMLSLFFASFFVHKFFSFSLSLRHQHVGANSKSGN